MSIWRKIQYLEFIKVYKNDSNFSVEKHTLKNLAFLFIDDINKHYLKIKERILKDFSDFKEFFIYF